MPSLGKVTVLVCFLTVINIKSNVGRGLILFYNTQSIVKGVRAGTEAKTIGECFLRACFLQPSFFLMPPGSPFQGVVSPRMGWL